MNVDELIKKVNETYEKNVNTKLVFGDSIEKNGITVIPVSKVVAKVGQGHTFNINISNNDKKKTETENKTNEAIEKNIEKAGYGIDAKMTPMGYIEIKEGAATYHPILDITRMGMAGICFAGVSVFLFTRMVTRIAKLYCKKSSKNHEKQEKHDKKKD